MFCMFQFDAGINLDFCQTMSYDVLICSSESTEIECSRFADLTTTT